MIIGIDSGADQGWAVFDHLGKLVRCGTGRLPTDVLIWGALVERPHPHRTRARVQDIITLAIRAGETGHELRSRGADVEYVEPNVWKGGALPKPVSHRIINSKLTPVERALVKRLTPRAKAKALNMWDAIGIGLYACGR